MTTQTDYRQALAATVKTAIETSETNVLRISNSTGIPRSTLIRELEAQGPFNGDHLFAVAQELGMMPSEFFRAAEFRLAAPEIIAEKETTAA